VGLPGADGQGLTVKIWTARRAPALQSAPEESYA
jgi:hypothetical protein